MKKQIAIIEDDQSINQGIALTLGKEEYDFYQFYNLSDNVNNLVVVRHQCEYMAMNQ